MAKRKNVGNPAKQAERARQEAEERARAKREQREAAQRQAAKRARTKKFAWIGGSIAVVAVIAAVVTVWVTRPEPLNSYEAGGTGAEIEGVETFDNGTEHVEGTVDYPQDPPAGGPHNVAWLNCGVYTEPQANENAVHSLEHGAVWVTHNAKAAEADVQKLKDKVAKTSYTLMSPVPDQQGKITLTAWGHQLTVDTASDPRIEEFLSAYVQGEQTPEPGAACTGGMGTA